MSNFSKALGGIHPNDLVYRRFSTDLSKPISETSGVEFQQMYEKLESDVSVKASVPTEIPSALSATSSGTGSPGMKPEDWTYRKFPSGTLRLGAAQPSDDFLEKYDACWYKS
eukprot:GDKH01013331.1.p4 GENE.GDKH01013331.1~~GDKH01013331.1.p4  ORF type:complete len:112 (-),score=13.50 GDKH01013331.1:1039-1374(-)